tara:strand:- start:3618 stop:4511 length:894 start_codon:yes stop_codon:yes gene_type:complete
MKKKILIFSAYSKKNGIGHSIRSERLYKILKKKYDCKLYINKKDNFINKIIRDQKKRTIIICDFKKYKKNIVINNKMFFYILFDQSTIKAQNLISINPLNLETKKIFNGPKWFIFPKNFSKRKMPKKFKKKFNIFISQGGTDANNNLRKIVNNLNVEDEKINKVFVKIPKLNYINFYHKKIIYIKKMNNLFKILDKIDVAISGCGNFSYEINYFKIPTVYISNEKDEIIRGKKYQESGLGKFFKINQVSKAINELNILMNNKNYYNRMIVKRSKIFKKDNTSNVYKLIRAIFNKNVF